MRLENKVAFITGAGKGIGQGIVEVFAREGAALGLYDLDAQALSQTVQQLSAIDARYIDFCGDVASPSDIQAAIDKTAEMFGGLDILVANAGVAIPGSVTEISLEDWHRILSVNLDGTFHVSHFGIPHLLKRGGGSVINITSTQGWRGFAGWAGYAATKGAIIALTRQTAIEYSKQNIRVNSIAPGAIDTPMNEWVFNQAEDPADERRKWDEGNPLGRIGRADDIAEAALYLASDDAEWVTGICLVVDGGQLAGSG